MSGTLTSPGIGNQTNQLANVMATNVTCSLLSTDQSRPRRFQRQYLSNALAEYTLAPASTTVTLSVQDLLVSYLFEVDPDGNAGGTVVFPPAIDFVNTTSFAQVGNSLPVIVQNVGAAQSITVDVSAAGLTLEPAGASLVLQPGDAVWLHLQFDDLSVATPAITVQHLGITSTSAGGAADLATVLSVGNVTGGSDIILSSSLDIIHGADSAGGSGASVTVRAGNTTNAGSSAGSLLLQGGNAVDTSGGDVMILSGSTSASGPTGDVTVQSEQSASGGSTGALTLETGVNNNASAGSSGAVTLQSGGLGNAAATGDTGSLDIRTGTHAGSGGNVGDMTIGPGTATAAVNAGTLDVFAGDSAGAAGNATFRGGDSTSATADAGWITLRGGNTAGSGSGGTVFMYGGDNTGAGPGGDIEVITGNSTSGDSGAVTFQSRNIGNVGGDTGTVTIQSGALSNAGSTGNVGNLLIATGAHAGTAAGAAGAQLDLLVGSTTGTTTPGRLTLTGADQTGSANAGAVRVEGGTSLGSAGLGGPLELISGNSTTGNTGIITLMTQNNTGGGGVGFLNVITGDCADAAGAIGRLSVIGGDIVNASNGNAGGFVDILAGDTIGTGTGGDLRVIAGDCTNGAGGRGGNLTLQAGVSAGSADGNVFISANTNTIDMLSGVTFPDDASGTVTSVAMRTYAEDLLVGNTYSITGGSITNAPDLLCIRSGKQVTVMMRDSILFTTGAVAGDDLSMDTALPSGYRPPNDLTVALNNTEDNGGAPNYYIGTAIIRPAGTIDFFKTANTVSGSAWADSSGGNNEVMAVSFTFNLT